MFRRFPSLAGLIALALVLVVAGSLSCKAFADWDKEYSPVKDPPAWAAYYRKIADVLLGPERRLLNGVSWRLQLDTSTKLALPRITWMPNARSMRTANDMLDMVHGGAMLFSRAMGQELEQLNDWERRNGYPPLEYDRPVVQTDVGLTYATPRLVSVVDLGYVVSGGTGVDMIIRGLTFNLATKQVFRVEACTGQNYLFQFGKLLRVCDRETYLKFIQLLTTKAALIDEQTAGSKDPVVARCSEKAGPFIGEDQQIVLYLTFKGLAVHNTEYWPNSSLGYCTLQRSPVNPVILPYRELEPFMIPGAWRDELLKLR